jgi:hypothetical protein
MAPQPASIHRGRFKPANYETIRGFFEAIFPTSGNIRKPWPVSGVASISIMGFAMNAISNVLPLAICETSVESHPITTIALFCCAGLVASLGLIGSLDLATAGIDVSAYLY